MANETTRTTQSSLLFTEVMSGEVISAHLPKMVFAQNLHMDSLDGANSGTKQFPKWSDLGAAGALTEGTAFTTNTSFAQGTAITVTPTEIGMQGVVTDRHAQKRIGIQGATSFDILMHGSDQQRQAVFRHEIMRLGAAVMEGVETTALALIDDATDSVGTTTQDITLANALQAIYELRANEPLHEDFAFTLTENQIYELQLEALSTSGGVAGTLWSSQAQASALTEVRPDMARNGLRGAFLGVPVYGYSPSLNITANSAADVVGNLMCVGRGAPESATDGKVGYGVLVEGAPLKIEFDRDLDQRGTRIQIVYEVAAAELVDLNAVKIVTDAP